MSGRKLKGLFIRGAGTRRTEEEGAKFFTRGILEVATFGASGLAAIIKSAGGIIGSLLLPTSNSISQSSSPTAREYRPSALQL